MKNNNPENRRLAKGRSSHNAELSGYVELGMKKEALKLARRILCASRLEPEDFSAAVHAILTQADKVKPWLRLVESAHKRLRKRDQRAVRFSMLSFHYARDDYEAAARFIPKRFIGESAPPTMAFALDTWVSLGKMDEADKLARKLSRAFPTDAEPLLQATLLQSLGEYFARQGNWDQALAIWEMAQQDATLNHSAVVNLVEIHAARALLAIRRGLELIHEFKKGFDPESETMLPGNDEGIQRDAEKEFLRLQKILARVVPKARQKELGIDQK